MGTNLMKVFTPVDWVKYGKQAADLMSLTFSQNKRTGTKIARAFFSDGTALIRKVSATGIIEKTTIELPKITSTLQRNTVICDLIKNGHTQQEVAAMLNISQATVSNVWRSLKK